MGGRHWGMGKWFCCLLALLYCCASHAGTVHYYYTDPQGNVLAKADAQGNIIARYDYKPYGSSVASLGVPPDGPGYTGHVNDPDTGLVYMQARYYDPETGRFLSVDPNTPTAANTFNFNRYEYANNNPVVNIDPDGRQGTMAAGTWTGQAVMAQRGPRQVQHLNEINTAQAKLAGGAISAAAGGEVAGFVKAVLMLRNALGDTPKAASKGEFHAPGDVPNSQVIVRGGTSDMPAPGQVFSGSQGSSVADAAAGVPSRTNSHLNC